MDLHPTVHHNSSRFINLKIQISKVQAVSEIKFCLIHLVDLPSELFQTLRCLPPPVLGLGNMTSWRFHGHPWAPSQVWCVEKLWKHICDSTSEQKHPGQQASLYNFKVEDAPKEDSLSTL